MSTLDPRLGDGTAQAHPPAYERVVHPIEQESFRRLRARLDTSHFPPLTRAVVERVIHSAADLDYATDLVTDEAALVPAHAALHAGAPVVVDVEMVAAGITRRDTVCRLKEARSGPGLTRSAHAVRLAYEQVGPGALWVIGCAPTALEELLTLDARPALVIGLPVGFVGATESKAALRESGLPAVSNISEKGGSAVAAAALNALLYHPPGPQPRGPGTHRTTRTPAPPPYEGDPVSTTAPALLVAGHGTRDDAGAEAFRSFVEELGRRHPELTVAGGFIELSPPPLGEAVTGLVEQGVRRFAAVPLMLVSAGHAKGDIPAALAREKERHPGISYTYGRPLGPHPALLSVLERRVDEVRGDWAREEVTVLLVGRGSTDPDANAEVHKAARLFWEGRGYAGVETAFVSLAAPDVPSGLDRCVRLGAGKVVVLPYFLFTGILPERVRQQAAGWAQAHPEAEVRCAEVIGPEEELLDLVMERYREALKGDLRMNCDSCVYRVALPGFEDKVGMPQQPHFHPDDDGHHHHHGAGHHHGHAHAH